MQSDDSVSCPLAGNEQFQLMLPDDITIVINSLVFILYMYCGTWHCAGVREGGVTLSI